MTWSALGERDRRVILLGIAVLALGAVVRMVWLPYFGRLREAEMAVVQEAGALRKERALVRAARTYRVAFDFAGERWLSMIPQLMRGESIASVQASLSQEIDDAARQASAYVSRIELLPPHPAGSGLVGIPMRLEGESDYEGLLSLLAVLEAGPTTLHVRDLEVRGREQTVGGGMGSGPEITVLSFRFSVTAFVLQDESGPHGATTTTENPVASGEPGSARR